MSEYPLAQRSSGRLGAGSTRAVGLALPAVREKLLPLLRQLDLSLTTEQFSLLVAERGSPLGGLTMSPARVPVELRIDLDGSDGGTTLTIRMEDRWKVPLARNWGAVSVYAKVFAEVLGAIDAMLGRLDPKAAAGFEPWWRTFDDAAAANQSVAAAAARAEQVVARQTSRLLDGPQSGPRSAMEGAGLKTVTFIGADKVAELQAEDVDGLLTAGQLVAAKPGKLPAPLVKQVQDFVVTLEGDLAEHSAQATARQVSVGPTGVPVVSFLHQQAKLRELLPIRILMVCSTCRLEKVVNPDFARMRERSRRAKALSGSIGAVFGSHQISPYILVGKLIQVKKTDPDFVCTRCQGLDADQSMITFCPQCGDRRTETVLRACPKCDFDFRTLLPTMSLWRAPAQFVPMLPLPTPMPAEITTTNAPTEPEPTATVTTDDPSVPWQWSPAAPAVRESAPVGAAGRLVNTDRCCATTRGGTATTRGGIASTRRLRLRPAGWYADPWRHHQLRYYDGSLWTAYASTNGASRDRSRFLASIPIHLALLIPACLRGQLPPGIMER